MMLRNTLLRHFSYSIINQIRHSALFVNGVRASEQFVYVTPHVDPNDYLRHKESWQEQFNKRGISIDLSKVENLWTVYEELKNQKLSYEKKKSTISASLGTLLKIESDSDETKKLKIQINVIKDNLKKLREPFWAAEEAAMVEFLSLPNYLHPRTPDTTQVLFSHLSQPTNKKYHLKLGEELNLINFMSNENYYLTGDAAIFELGTKFYFNRILRNNKFVQFSNADFVKSFVVEGCGIDHRSSNASFILHHDEDSKVNHDLRLHLTGGGSLCSFMAYHTKNVLYPKVLPLKYFAMGRQYVPSASKEHSLFHVSQASVVEIFGVTRCADDLDVLLDNLTDIVKSIYTNFGYHFRISLVPANKLHKWESLRVAIEMYSSSMERYIEIGNISLSGDYISKRLRFCYTEKKQEYFTHIISGTVLNVPKFLGCVLEQDQDFQIPEYFKVANWSM